MTALTEPQIIMDDGKPAFAVIPWDEYQALLDQYQIENETWIPHEVVKAAVLDDISLIRAWREYLNLTQQ
jgi:hypothetical protein